jgi:NodT family efflux transporter outer membrane factor (OMF) lipoprotein
MYVYTALFVEMCRISLQTRSNLWKAALICSTAAAFLPGNISLAQRGYFKNDCKVGPEYCRPAAPVAPGWIDEGNPRVKVWAQREQLWWIALGDPTLNSLIQSAYAQNLTLRAAGMRVLVARAQRNFAAGNLFPQFQQGFGGYDRIAESLEVANRSVPRDRFFDNWILGGQLLWELDFWGQFRRNLTAADARLDARIEDYDDVLVILVSDVASAYIDYRTFEQRLTYARQNLGIQEESARLATLKVDAGVKESDLDLAQAKSDLAAIKSLIPDLELGRRQAMNRLSVLLGMPPSDIAQLLGERPIPLPPPELALGIPADLLRQRPDIRSAERELAAQCEQIGIAVAQLYPHISISGTIFVEADKFSNLFTSDSWGGAVGPHFRWDILNYGRLAANIRLQQARFNELIYDYQHRVLLANEEVENAIAAYLYSHQRVKALQEGTAVSSEAVQIGSTRYSDGVSDFNRLSNLQIELAQQQDALAFSQGQVARSWVDVYRSLGGGWQIRLPNARPYQPGIDDEGIPEGHDLPSPNEPEAEQNAPSYEPTPAEADASVESPAEPQLLESAQPSFTETIRSKLSVANNFLFHRKSSTSVRTDQPSADAVATVPQSEVSYPDPDPPLAIEAIRNESLAALSSKEYDPARMAIDFGSRVNARDQLGTKGVASANPGSVDIGQAFGPASRIDAPVVTAPSRNGSAIRFVIETSNQIDVDEKLPVSNIAMLQSDTSPSEPDRPPQAVWRVLGKSTAPSQSIPQPPSQERVANLPPSDDITPITDDLPLFPTTLAKRPSTITIVTAPIQAKRTIADEGIILR